MRLRTLHAWMLSPKDAIALQGKLAARVRLAPLDPAGVRTVAGADIAIDKVRNEAVAAVIVFSSPGLEEIERQTARATLAYPYIPGLLSFREAPVLLAAFEKLSKMPDVALFDGQGIAHPRRLGLASHMGLWLEIPTIGCAKSRLCGECREPGIEAGAWAPLTLPTEGKESVAVVGACLRTRRGVRPIFVSPGHRVDPASALAIVMGCCDGVRIPKPTRLADQLVSELKGAST